MRAEGGSKIGFSYNMFEGNEDDKVEDRSLVVGTEVGPCDGMSDVRDVG